MSDHPKGKFITIEGIEGVGKTTNITAALNYLRSRGLEVVLTREPGGTPLAEEVRKLLLMVRDETVSEKTELLMMFAARAQHIETLIKPNLEAGRWVLSDRFTDATFAYQGGGRGLPWSMISQLESMVQDELQPDLTLILDVEPEVGLARAKGRGELDRIEREEIGFFHRVRNAYLQRVEENPHRYKVIDAGQELQLVTAAVVKAVSELQQG